MQFVRITRQGIYSGFLICCMLSSATTLSYCWRLSASYSSPPAAEAEEAVASSLSGKELPLLRGSSAARFCKEESFFGETRKILKKIQFVYFLHGKTSSPSTSVMIGSVRRDRGTSSMSSVGNLRAFRAGEV